MNDRYLKQKGDFDVELAFASEVLKVPSLHYGYWLPSEKATLASIPKAQNRYSKFVTEQIPSEVRSILDVGAGLGDISEILLNMGKRVIAVTPNPTHKNKFEVLKKKHKMFTFIFDKYENLDTNFRYDLVMFNESSAYIDTKTIFEKAGLITSDKGYVQICDIFSIKDRPPIGKNSSLSDTISIANHAGFKLEKKTDITTHVLPTLQIGKDLYTNYISPTLEIGKKYYAQEHPIKSFLMRTIFFFFLKDEIKSFYGYFDLVFSPEEFRKHFTYELLLFKKL